MSATPPSSMEGTHAPSPFEVLWERYRSLILTVVIAIFAALLGNYAWKWYDQQQRNERVSAFIVSIGAEDTYSDSDGSPKTLTSSLVDKDLQSLEAAQDAADEKLKPFYLMAIARRSMVDGDWDRATKALDDLESKYPKHSLVRASKLPVQSRVQEEPDEDSPASQRKIKWKPAREGSAVSLMRAQVEAAKGFVVPDRFSMPTIPEDAPKVKFTLGDFGEFTIVLMPQAPKHTEAFLKLAKEGYWTGVAVDEIQRGTESFKMPYSLHLGYASTKEDDRTKWTTTEPSEHQVDFEETGLSHFPGAVAARPEAEGMSCANRLWINVDDAARNDDGRVVFGYVVEGLEVLRQVCDAGLSAQDEDRGMGRPTENIRVTAVEVL